MKPTVGRIVHYVAYGTPPDPDGAQRFASQCRAAVVAEVISETELALAVLNPTGLFFNTSDADEDTKAGGTWHWPPRDGQPCSAQP